MGPLTPAQLEKMANACHDGQSQERVMFIDSSDDESSPREAAIVKKVNKKRKVCRVLSNNIIMIFTIL